MKVVPANQFDLDWITVLFNQNSKILGSASQVMYRWLHQRSRGEKMLVIRPYAFAHFNVRKDGWKTLHEIAVSEAVKRQGYGKALMEAIGYPMQLKTDADNEESNLFYQKLGFACMGQKTTRSGKLVNIYQRFC